MLYFAAISIHSDTIIYACTIAVLFTRFISYPETDLNQFIFISKPVKRFRNWKLLRFMKCWSDNQRKSVCFCILPMCPRARTQNSFLGSVAASL